MIHHEAIGNTKYKNTWKISPSVSCSALKTDKMNKETG